jgi:hypothetical protein
VLVFPGSGQGALTLEEVKNRFANNNSHYMSLKLI